MKKETLIYPFERSLLPIVRYGFCPAEIEIKHYISPVSWGLNGVDAGSLDNGESLGQLIGSDFRVALDQSESVIFAQGDHSSNIKEDILANIEIAIYQNKDVYSLVALEANELERFKHLADERGTLFNNYYATSSQAKVQFTQDANVTLQEINSPIIFVMSLTEAIGKFEMQIALNKYINSIGYSSILVGSRNYSEFGKAISMPDFMLSSSVAEHEKIVKFNMLVKSIENEYNPDVIIVGIPGGILPQTRYDVKNLGITAFEISRAVRPDLSIVCLPCDNFTDEYATQLNNISKFRFSSSKNFFAVNNMAFPLSDPNSTVDCWPVVIDQSHLGKICDVEYGGFHYYPFFNKNEMFAEIVSYLGDDDGVVLI